MDEQIDKPPRVLERSHAARTELSVPNEVCGIRQYEEVAVPKLGVSRAAVFCAVTAFAAIAIAIAVTGYFVTSGDHHPGGDTGGHLLKALSPVVAAVPNGARVAYVHKQEPIWESCDGRVGTFGWGDVVVQVSFTSSLAPTAVFKYADAVLTNQAWTRVSLSEPDGPGVASTWTKVIPPAVDPVRVTLSNNTPYRDWALFTSATPIGHPVRGC